MEEAQMYRLKAFLWDQLIRPIYLLLNMHQLKGILLAILILSITVFDSINTFWITSVALIVIFSYDIYKYYKSGEFMYNYRKYNYRKYKKATKAFKREIKKDLNTLNNLNNDGEEEKEEPKEE